MMMYVLTPTSLLYYCLLVFFNFSLVYTGTSYVNSESRLAGLTNLSRYIKTMPDDQVVFDNAEKCGFKAERFYVTTYDGYILTMHRLSSDNNQVSKGSVLMIHGFLCSSAYWILNDCDQSLAFLLVQAGYVVWLGNTRGSDYSLQNKHYTTADSRFWAFSMDEPGTIDLPAMMDYALEATGETKLALIGHSMGGAQSLIMLSTLPKYNDNVTVCILLAPPVNFTSATSLLYPVAASFRLWPTDGPFLGKDNFINRAGFMCHNPAVNLFCVPIWDAFFGKEDPIQFNETRRPEYLKYFPGVSSIRCLKHVNRIQDSGYFQTYNDPKPFDFSPITAQTYVVSAENDILCPPGGQERLAEVLPKCVGYCEIESAAHMDLVLSINRNLNNFDQMLCLVAKSFSSKTLPTFKANGNLNCPNFCV